MFDHVTTHISKILYTGSFYINSIHFYISNKVLLNVETNLYMFLVHFKKKKKLILIYTYI